MLDRYADPTCSVISALIIFSTGWGVTKACAWILLQAAPPSVDTAELSNAILNVQDVVDVHELHVWQLVDNLSLATLHIVIREGASSAPRCPHPPHPPLFLESF